MVGHTRTNSASQNISFSSTSIGEYVLGKTLGEGSCAIVKLGTHQTTGQKVAVKIIKPNSLQEQKEVLREVESLQVLKHGSHPHIIKLIQLIKEGGFTCLILELAEGGELFNYIVDSGRLKESEARRIFRQVVSAVLYSHAHLVVHRDLKPENLILDAKNNIKVTDFGLSNILKPGMLFSTFCGSPVYTSPEVVLHKQYNGTIADVWSLGAVLYVMVTGGMPWRLEQNAVKNMDQLLAAKFKLPDSLGLSEEVKDLIRKMLTADCKTRATLEQVARHPWMNIGFEGPITAYLKPKPLVSAKEINDNVLEHLVLLGMDICKAREDITKDPTCPALTAYHNILEKHQRACRVVSDYHTVDASNVAENPDLSPSRTRAKSAPSDKGKIMPPVLDKILSLRSSDPLGPRSSTHMDRVSPLSLSDHVKLPDMDTWDYNRYTESPVRTPNVVQISSARVPRRSVELRDLFSAPSMPDSEIYRAEDLSSNQRSLLPNMPASYCPSDVMSPFYNPFSLDAERPDLIPSVTSNSNSKIYAPKPISPLAKNPFFDQELPVTPSTPPSQTRPRFVPTTPMTPMQPFLDPSTPLTPTQHALLFPSRTDSPTNALASPYIPPVTMLKLARGEEGQIVPVPAAPGFASSSPSSIVSESARSSSGSALVLGTQPCSPDTKRRVSSPESPARTYYNAAPRPAVALTPSPSPTARKTAIRGFLDMFRRSPSSKSLSIAPNNSSTQPPVITATRVDSGSKKGSALRFNNSPTHARRAIFSKN